MLGHHRLEHQIDMRDFGQLDNICNSLKPNTFEFSSHSRKFAIVYSAAQFTYAQNGY